jgi:glucose/arabinose dehydrogenase
MRKEILHLVKATFPLIALLLSTTCIQSQPTIGYQPVITGLSAPMEVVTAPGDATGRLFIVEKAGNIRVWNGTTVLATPFLNITGIVEDGGEQGLLSMAFHPDYATNGFFYVYHNNNSGNVTVARYFATPGSNTANAGSRVEIFNASKPFTNHNGAHLQFKVTGGINYLYFATGDGGDGNDPQRNAQNPSSMLGKMIRLNVDLPVPITPEIWAWGLRNPFRWSFDRATGDMWIGDVGQGLREEVHFRAAGSFGANYGWPCFEGTLVNSAGQSGSQCDTVTTAHVAPIFEYPNPASGASSVVGGYVYRGTEYPMLTGYYIVADFYSGTVWVIQPNPSGGWIVSPPQPGLTANISSFSETNDGSTLYAVALTAGTVSKVVAAIPTPLTLLRFSGKNLGAHNELKWVTGSEIDIDKYVIEYSSNGRSYQAAGELPALYPSGGTYQFNHTISSGALFYRLRIIETDGRSYYSPVIRLGGTDKGKVQVYPTLVTNSTVNIVAAEPVQQITLFNVEGRQVMSKTMNGQDGYFQLNIPVLNKGMYYLRIQGQNNATTEKLIIQ